MLGHLLLDVPFTHSARVVLGSSVLGCSLHAACRGGVRVIFSLALQPNVVTYSLLLNACKRVASQREHRFLRGMLLGLQPYVIIAAPQRVVSSRVPCRFFREMLQQGLLPQVVR